MVDGHPTPGNGDEERELDELEPVFADLRTAFVRPAPPEVAADHIARMTAAAREVATLSVAPAQSRRRADAAEHPWRRKVAIVAAALGAAIFGTGGLAVAGALPGPVQDVVATVVEPLGLDLPHSDDEKSDDPDEIDGSPSNGAGNGAGSGEAPGQTGQTPGQSGETPANGAEPPGQSGTTPGQSGENPGNSGSAPGQTGEPPPNAGGGNPNAGSGNNSGGSNPNAGSGNNSGGGGTNPNSGSGNNNAGGNSAGGAANGNGGGNGGNSADAPGQNR